MNERMLYNLVYRLVWLTKAWYFSHFQTKKLGPGLDQTTKGRLFAVNHNNSFLDAILVATQLPFQVHFLVRGDAMRGNTGNFLTKYFNMLPIWREREGREHLKANYDTFAYCQALWQKQGSLIIFTEGLCENDWHLKPFPKGTARLVWQAHQAGLALEIIPTGINYEHFRGPGKQCEIRMGAPMAYADLLEHATEAQFYRAFNARLFAHMQPLVIEAKDAVEAKNKFMVPASPSFLRSLVRPIAKGLHWPYYAILKRFAARSTAGTVHYDAVLFGMLMLSYPVYLMLIASVFAIIGLPYLWLATLLWPALAFAGR